MEFMHPPDRVAPLEKLTYNLVNVWVYGGSNYRLEIINGVYKPRMCGGPYLAKDVLANSHHLVKSILKPLGHGTGRLDWFTGVQRTPPT